MSARHDFRDWLDGQILKSVEVSKNAPIGTPLYERGYHERRAEILKEVRSEFVRTFARYGEAP